jgi:23S rRNA (guanosine2251-2'-O)-methyltransferase
MTGPRAGRGPRAARASEVVVGGRRAVTEAVRAGLARRVMVAEGVRENEGLRSLTEAARRAGLAVESAGVETLDRMGMQDHQGVAAVVSLPKELDDRGLRGARFEDDAIVVVLDGILDPQNFGASARSAEAAGVSMLVTRKRRAAPLSASAVRASAGALLHVPVARVTNLARALEDLKERGFHVIGLEQEAGNGIHEASVPSRPLALVVGAEETGISRLVRESCDELVSIPMAGRTASLNASAALAVALFGFALRPG